MSKPHLIFLSFQFSFCDMKNPKAIGVAPKNEINGFPV
jgi:hypothetical protein